MDTFNLISAAGVPALARLGGMIAAGLFFGAHIFDPTRPAFRFVMIGFGLAVSLTLFQTGGSRFPLIAFILLFLLDMLSAGSRFAGTHLVFWAGALAAVSLFHRYYHRPPKGPFLARTLPATGGIERAKRNVVNFAFSVPGILPCAFLNPAPGIRSRIWRPSQKLTPRFSTWKQ